MELTATKVLPFEIPYFEDYTSYNRHYLFDDGKWFRLIKKKNIEKGIEIYGTIWVSFKVRKHVSDNFFTLV